MIEQVPGGNIGANAQAAADGGAAQHPADPAPDGLAPANPQEAGNPGDEAELDDEEEDDDGEEDEEDEDDEEGREEDAADANNGGQGQFDAINGFQVCFTYHCSVHTALLCTVIYTILSW